MYRTKQDRLRAECLWFLEGGHNMVLRKQDATPCDLVCEGMPFDTDPDGDGVATAKEAVQALSSVTWQVKNGLAFFEDNGNRIISKTNNGHRYSCREAVAISLISPK